MGECSVKNSKISLFMAVAGVLIAKAATKNIAN
jgi:hypothetical protein